MPRVSNITQIVAMQDAKAVFPSALCPLPSALCPLPSVLCPLSSALGSRYISVMHLTLTVVPDSFAVCRLAPADPIPAWAKVSSIFSITRTAEELSIVAPEAAAPADVRAERGWRALKIAGPIDFALTGVLASVLQPLAEARIGIFAISTFDTDYVLVRAESLASTIAKLRAAGHTVQG